MSVDYRDLFTRLEKCLEMYLQRLRDNAQAKSIDGAETFGAAKAHDHDASLLEAMLAELKEPSKAADPKSSSSAVPRTSKKTPAAAGVAPRPPRGGVTIRPRARVLKEPAIMVLEGRTDFTHPEEIAKELGWENDPEAQKALKYALGQMFRDGLLEMRKKPLRYRLLSEAERPKR